MTPQPELARSIEARTVQLARESAEPFHRDPFWYARYGEARTRRFGDEDAVFHVRYLVQALSQGAPSVMEGYARWLRTLLVGHGMCTLHLSQHFGYLQEVLTAHGLSSPEVRGLIASAQESLRYREGNAAVVGAGAEAVAQRASRMLGHGADRALQAELQLQVAYLADALAARRPELFLAHARFYGDFWPQRGLGNLSYPRVLQALLDGFDALPSPASTEARALLTGALASLQR